ncbi:MAG: type III pantothenate kinase [Chloroflexota bacterium]
MLLVIDIGNTETTLGVFEGENLKATWHIATVINRTADELAPLLVNLLGNKGLQSSDIKEVSFCSVVPPLITIFEEVFRHYFKISPMVVAAGVKTGVRICMDNPREVGADRIVNAAAAHHLYSGPVIIVDMGTATTFDIVSEKGDYMGGAIAPGLVTATEAMFRKAAMLPRVELMRPEHAIGTNTIDAMKSGIVFGYVGLVEGMVARIQRELGIKTKVIATGGHARLIAGETKVIDEVSPDLTLIGLKLIYRMNKS